MTSESPSAGDNSDMWKPSFFKGTKMSTRDEILKELAGITDDPNIPEMRQDLQECRAAIEAHELTRLHNRAAELAHQIELGEMKRHRRMGELERRLQDEEPQEVFDIRTTLAAAFQRHQMSTTPTVIRAAGADNSEFKSWRDRGEALCDCCTILRDLWRAPDCMERLSALVDKYRHVLPELRHVHVQGVSR